MSGRITIDGEHVRLRPVVGADKTELVAIRATENVRRRWRGDDLESEFDDSLEDNEVVRLAIEAPVGVTVGMIQFEENEDQEYRHVALDIYVDPTFQRRGYASDAIRTLVHYLFDELGHHRATIDPAADNEAAIRCYESVGFKMVGLMQSYERQADGTWADGLLMELIADDRTRTDGSLTLAKVSAMEMTLLDPKVRGDRHRLEKLLHPEFIEFGSSGRVLARADILSQLPGALEVEDFHARWVSGGTILVTYRTTSSERLVLRSSLWALGRDGWQVVFHQGTLTSFGSATNRTR